MYWAAIKKYVRGILNIYYTDDDNIKSDSQVQNWIHEVKTKGFNNAKNAEMPSQIDSLDQLETIITMIIFNLSVGHAAEMNAMWDVMGNVPNCSGVLFKPMQRKVYVR